MTSGHELIDVTIYDISTHKRGYWFIMTAEIRALAHWQIRQSHHQNSNMWYLWYEAVLLNSFILLQSYDFPFIPSWLCGYYDWFQILLLDWWSNTTRLGSFAGSFGCISDPYHLHVGYVLKAKSFMNLKGHSITLLNHNKCFLASLKSLLCQMWHDDFGVSVPTMLLHNMEHTKGPIMVGHGKSNNYAIWIIQTAGR